MKKWFIATLILGSTSSSLASPNDSWNLRFSPIGLLIGMVSASLDYKLTDQWVAGPTMLFWDVSIGDFSMKASGFGAETAFYFNGAYSDSFYLGGAVTSASVSASDSNSSGDKFTASASSNNFGLRAGYHWFWDTVNLNLGLTAISSSLTKVEVKDNYGTVVGESTSPGTGTGLEFEMGFTF